MKAHAKKCRKMLKFFRKFENIHDFFDFFEVFHRKTFKHSEAQTRDIYHWIRHKIPHRTVNMRSLSSIEQKWFQRKNRPKMGFYGG